MPEEIGSGAGAAAQADAQSANAQSDASAANNSQSEAASAQANAEAAANAAANAPAASDQGKAPKASAKAGGQGKAGGLFALGNEEEGDEPDSPLHKPISDWSKVDLDLPDGTQTDPALMESLGKAVIEAGLTEAQARALAKWNLDAISQTRARLMEEGNNDLAQVWGNNVKANARQAMSLVARIDRALAASSGQDGLFSKALAACGADMQANVIKGLFEASRWLSEDSLGKTGFSMPEKPETPYEGLMDALRQAKAGR